MDFPPRLGLLASVLPTPAPSRQMPVVCTRFRHGNSGGAAPVSHRIPVTEGFFHMIQQEPEYSNGNGVSKGRRRGSSTTDRESGIVSRNS